MINDRPSRSPFPMRQAPRRPGQAGPVLAVGGRVIVTLAPGVASLMLSDENSIPTGKTVPRDVEAEIVAWRPRGPNGARYRIRCVPDRLEGWVDAPTLRAVPLPPPAVRAAAPTPAARVVAAAPASRTRTTRKPGS